jgi:hypothetical protein
LLSAGMLLVIQAGGSAEDDRAEEEGAVVEVVKRAPRLDDDLFELWAFGGNRDRHRRGLARKLDVAVKLLDLKYSLSEEEREKLVLAGQADLQRYFAEAEILRQKFHATCGDHRKLRDVHREALELRAAGDSRWFDESSFFAKVVRRTLKVVTASRATACRQQLLRSVAERAAVPLESIASLRPEQSETPAALLPAEKSPINAGEDDDVLMKSRLTEFSAEQLRPLFDEAQRPRVQAVLNVFQDSRAGLEARGLIDGRMPGRGVKDFQ